MKKLQVKMVLVAFVSSVTVLGILALGLYLAMAHYNANRADAMTSLISYGDGVIPSTQGFSENEFENSTRYRIRLNDESAFRQRYFIVWLDENDNVSEVQTDHIASINETDARSFALEVLLRGKNTGYYKEYRYRIADGKNDQSAAIIFLDCRDELYVQNAMLYRIITLTVLFALCVTLVFAVFSRKILKPFEKNQRMQKQFITDASHELKTPLAVISANADVLKFKGGENEWLDNITSQTQKMSRLINQLLVLARMEEMGERIEKETIDLSEITENSVSKLGEIFSRKNVKLETMIETGITISANRNQMENLCDVLIENASKYVNENGEAGIKLTSLSGKKVTLQVFNTAENCENIDCERIFERFYRSDESRTSSTGGHGIGLSIAKRIVEQHKGSICASAENGRVTFSVKLPA